MLAFGTRVPIELCYLPRAGHSWAGPAVVPSGRFDLFPLTMPPSPSSSPGRATGPPNVVAVADVAEGSTARRP